MIFDDWLQSLNAPSEPIDWHLAYWIERAHKNPLWAQNYIWARETE